MRAPLIDSLQEQPIRDRVLSRGSFVRIPPGFIRTLERLSNYPVKLADQNLRISRLITLATFVLVVAAMKFAQEVLIPIALTILLTFLLTPCVVRLVRWGLPKAIAIVITATVAFAIIGSVTWVVFEQAIGLIQQLPDYEGNIRQKITALKTPHGQDALARLNRMLQKLQQDVQQTTDEPPRSAAKTTQKDPPHPVPVEVRAPQPSPLDVTRGLIGQLAAPLGTAAIVAVFVVAMLFQREDLRDRFITVVSAGRLNLAIQAIDDAARRVTRYLSMQLIVNACYGIPIGVALYFIGIPHAVLWGVLATLLRFIPFLGPWVAAAFPIILAAAVEPGWTKLLLTAGVFIVMETVSANIVEPMLYGAGTGISNLALMIAAVFWTWLWGTPGLFLSTPLTVCILVMGKYLPGLQFLSVLLGSEPILEPSAKFFQRMLSMDAEEMRTMANTYVTERSLDEFYDDVFVPALLMAEVERHSGALAEVKQTFIFESSRELIDELERTRESSRDAVVPAAEQVSTSTESAVAVTTEDGSDDFHPHAPVVFGMPARDDADEVVALMLQHLLRIKGVETEVLPVSAHTDEFARWINEHGVRIAFVSALPPAALIGTHQLIRKIKENCPDTLILVGVWDRKADFNDLKSRLRRPKPDAIVTNLSEAVRQIQHFLSAAPSDAPRETDKEPSLPASKTNTHGDFPSLHLTEVDPGELLDIVTRDLAQQFEVPVSLVSITTTDPQFWKERTGATLDKSQLEMSAGPNQVFSPDETLVVEDVTKDKRFSNITSLMQRGVRFYAGVPLRSRAGRIVGTLNVVDTKPRTVLSDHRSLLMLRAAELMEAVEADRKEIAAGT